MIARVLICAAIGMGLSVRTFADDCQLGWSVQGPIPGLNDIVFKSVAWDPDGAGPEPEAIVAFGNFTRAGDQAARGAAILRNGAWEPLGELRGEPDAVVVHNGETYVAGSFQVLVNGSFVNKRLLKWDGTAWRVVTPEPPLPAGSIKSFVSQNGLLYVGGGTQFRPGVSVFDGASWQTVWATAQIGRIALFQGSLVGITQVTIDGGTRGAIARWDGEAWQTIGVTDGPGAGMLLVASADSLFINGSFQSVSGVTAARIARWDGISWHAMGSGLTSFHSGVQDMTIHQGQLVIGGTFHDIGGNPLADKLARWDGSAWREMVPNTNSSIRTITPFGSQLFVAGSFNSLQNATALNAAFWENGQSQATVAGLTSSIRSIVRETPDELIISGTHTLSGPAKPFPVLTRVDGRWSWVGGATCEANTIVYALARLNGAIVAAGDFEEVNGQNLGDLLFFDGAEWRPLGQRLLGTVLRLAIFDGQLIAAGNFQIDGGDGSGDMAVFDGLQWRGLDLAADSNIRDIFVHGGRIYAVGDIRIGAEPTVQRVAYWDGQNWTPITGNMGGIPSAVAVYRDEVYIGGAFSSMTNLFPQYIARWNGAAWQSVGNEIASLGSVYALEEFNGELFAFAAGSPGTFVRAWDGQSWSDPYGGPGNGDIGGVTPWELIATPTDLYAMGFASSNPATGPSVLLRYAPTSGQWTDCNLNQVLDGCDIARGNSLDDDQDGVPDECQTPFVAGDMDCDGFLTIGDIGGFVLALTNPAQYAVQFPGCEIGRADMNNDMFVNVGDIGAFVLALTSP
ncbi:MAG: hypothetical protein SF069_00720 [Phycisphaerae bacterium]|nr:hypothetical protein [Phycisphaerae bacterium]